MTPEQFTYWLNGFAELSPDTPPTQAQWKLIQAHIALVLTKRTPKLEPEVTRKLFEPGVYPAPFDRIQPVKMPNKEQGWHQPADPGTLFIC
ncbi:MAG: hypothetical protein WC100_01420 [Sterolibacterium sp.]